MGPTNVKSDIKLGLIQKRIGGNTNWSPQVKEQQRWDISMPRDAACTGFGGERCNQTVTDRSNPSWSPYCAAQGSPKEASCKGAQTGWRGSSMSTGARRTYATGENLAIGAKNRYCENCRESCNLDATYDSKPMNRIGYGQPSLAGQPGVLDPGLPMAGQPEVLDPGLPMASQFAIDPTTGAV